MVDGEDDFPVKTIFRERNGGVVVKPDSGGLAYRLAHGAGNGSTQGRAMSSVRIQVE